jgi:acetylornithine deacetylase/succinyl-diaminopimelate desuccinylase-like protein
MHDLCKKKLTDKKLILILTADEEVGGKNGAAFLTDA